jgi:ABC-type bacteriocin/lantibiotic exporter with double-glycine peptidase domain
VPVQPPIAAKVFRAALLFAITLAGCYHGTARSVSPGELGRERGWTAVSDLRVIRQSGERDCGAAALAMLLRHWSVTTTPEEILAAVPRGPGHGITLGALRDLARQKGLAAFVIKGELADLTSELELGRPVLVGLVQRHGKQGLSHFGVVAGINPITRRVLLLDPARGLREDGFEGFATEWAAAGWATLVIVPS